MTVFKTFLKVLNKYKLTVILYTVILIFFGVFNFRTNDTSIAFTKELPDILIVNDDEEKGVTQSLINYIRENSSDIEVENNEEAIDDAVFYRDVNYVIYIPKNFNEDFQKGLNPDIKIKTTGDYQASLAELLLERFLKTANIYVKEGFNGEELVQMIDESISIKPEVVVSSNINTSALDQSTFFFNFVSYSLMAGAIQVICLVLSSFHHINIQKRTIISSTNYKEINRKLLLSNLLFSIFLWLIYVILSIVLLKDTIFTPNGLLYILNSFIFTICCTSIAFLISVAISDKNAINGIVNCIALGSSFLCGAFVPQSFLPAGVLSIAHVIPTYWFIASNELIAELDNINIDTLKPIIINMAIILIFTLIFIIITNIISKNKQNIS